jgi:hypothetical protein
MVAIGGMRMQIERNFLPILASARVQASRLEPLRLWS